MLSMTLGVNFYAGIVVLSVGRRAQIGDARTRSAN